MDERTFVIWKNPHEYWRDSNTYFIDFDDFVRFMDDDIREELHVSMAPCTKQEFFDAYLSEYEKRHGEELFVLDFDIDHFRDEDLELRLRNQGYRGKELEEKMKRFTPCGMKAKELETMSWEDFAALDEVSTGEHPTDPESKSAMWYVDDYVSVCVPYDDSGLRCPPHEEDSPEVKEAVDALWGNQELFEELKARVVEGLNAEACWESLELER